MGHGKHDYAAWIKFWAFSWDTRVPSNCLFFMFDIFWLMPLSPATHIWFQNQFWTSATNSNNLDKMQTFPAALFLFVSPFLAILKVKWHASWFLIKNRWCTSSRLPPWHSGTLKYAPGWDTRVPSIWYRKMIFQDWTSAGCRACLAGSNDILTSNFGLI